MRNKNKGFSLLEILIAFVLLTIVTVSAFATHYYVRQLNKEMGYRYTALNMAREMMEFGEAGRFIHEFSMKYYYPPAEGCTLEEGCYPGNPDEPAMCPPGLDTSTTGYKVKEWHQYCIGNPDPFDYLGDIEEKGLVPEAAKESVEIYYKVLEDADFDNAYTQFVEVQWQDKKDGAVKTEELSGIPIRQVNDQLQLITAEFWWE